MYVVDGHDRVVPLADVPQSNIGAPLPVVVAGDYRAFLGYLRDVPDPSWDGTSVRMIDMNSAEPGVLVTLSGHRAIMFGPPNDEAFAGHPLAARGLVPYSASTIENSSWVRELERMNAVHPDHRPEAFASLVHLVFAFHDSTFECVVESYQVELVPGPMSAIVAEMSRRLSAH